MSLEISPESRTSPNSLIRVSVQSRIALISEYSPNSLVFSTTKVAHLRITRTGFQNPSNCLSGKFLPEFSKVRIVPLPAPAAGSSKSAHLRQLLPEISMFGTGLRPVYTTTVRLTRLAATSTCRPPAGLSGRWRSPAAAAWRITLGLRVQKCIRVPVSLDCVDLAEQRSYATVYVLISR